MDKILKALSIIMENPDLQQELAEKKTTEDAYNYCMSISGGYTIDEFENFLYEFFKVVDNIPEEQLEKISGGIKINNKAISTMLAAMTMVSPLAGAAGGKSNEQPSYIQKIKDVAKKPPVVTAIGSSAGMGAFLLAIAKIYGHQTPQQPPLLPCLSGISEQFSRKPRIVLQIVDLFKQTGFGNESVERIQKLCADNPVPADVSFFDQIKTFLNVSNFIPPTTELQEFHFYRDFEKITSNDFIQTDTSDITKLRNLNIWYLRESDTKAYDGLRFTSEQKAVIVRYCQAYWLHKKKICGTLVLPPRSQPQPQPQQPQPQPPLLPCLSGISEPFSKNPRIVPQIVDLFKQTGFGNESVKRIQELYADNPAPADVSFFDQIKTCSNVLNFTSPTDKLQGFHFYRGPEKITDNEFIQTNTSDIAKLCNLKICYWTTSNTSEMWLGFTNEQKAIIVRYCQAYWLHKKGIH
ncbi:MAG: hypothetical protein LBR79_01700 [Oscillospiraceae bacterium]|nr:hypothetical protein [Oscillospiraceae bacterium]